MTAEASDAGDGADGADGGSRPAERFGITGDGAGLDGRDEVLDTLLGPGAQIRPGGTADPGCTLIGGVGLPWLRDLDFGTNWLARAASLDWPDDVVLEDLSYSAHRVLHRLQELEPARVILLGCMPRGIDPAGTIRRYRLSEVAPPGPEEVHERLAEAVGGIIDLDHTLAVCRHWHALPETTMVIEVEPAERDFGWGFSEPVEAAVAEVLEMVRNEVAGPGRAGPDRVPPTAEQRPAKSAVRDRDG